MSNWHAVNQAKDVMNPWVNCVVCYALHHVLRSFTGKHCLKVGGCLLYLGHEHVNTPLKE